MIENSTRQSWASEPIPSIHQADWIALILVLALSVVLRTVFYTGFFGSDEVTYVETAVNIASGDWRAPNYIGATRYGMNLPVALSIYLFGLSEGSANFWPFFCSVGEVAIVFVIARWLWSTRAAVISAGLLALLPLHVHFAGRMMADPPLALFLSLSVALLLYATHSKNPFSFFAAGLALGGVFWVKESVAILYIPVFLFLHVYLNRFNGKIFWIVAGLGVAIAANCLLMDFLAGNPLHIFAVMKKNVSSYATGNFDGLLLATSPWFYFRYLFMDIRHTFLLGVLSLAGILMYARCYFRNKQINFGIQFVILWAILLVGMFSFAIVSFAPVKLVMKQTNYILIFSAPLALVSGWFLASLPRRILIPLGVVIACGSIVLAALEQQAITVFTANSRASYAFLREHSNGFLVGTTNNQRAINFFSMLENHREFNEQVMSFSELAEIDNSNTPEILTEKMKERDIFAVLDTQNIDWGNKSGGIRRLSDVPKCWTSLGELELVSLGNGSLIVQGFVAASLLLPENLQQRYLSILVPVSSPAPAYLFRVDHSCL